MTPQVKGQAEFMPAGWKIKQELEQSCKWAQGKAQVLPYFLSPGKIKDTIRIPCGTHWVSAVIVVAIVVVVVVVIVVVKVVVAVVVPAI